MRWSSSLKVNIVLLFSLETNVLFNIASQLPEFRRDTMADRDLTTCPYNPAHSIKKSRLQAGLSGTSFQFDFSLKFLKTNLPYPSISFLWRTIICPTIICSTIIYFVLPSFVLPIICPTVIVCPTVLKINHLSYC